MSTKSNKSGFQCPVCKGAVGLELIGNKGPFPFCSERCKMVDLGKWLESDYTIPAIDQSVDDDALM